MHAGGFWIKLWVGLLALSPRQGGGGEQPGEGGQAAPSAGLSCFSGGVRTGRLCRKQITAVRASRWSRSASNPVDISPVLSRPPAPPKAALRDLARTARACRRSPELRPSLEGLRDLATQPMPMMRCISLDNCCKIALDERKIAG